MNVKSFFIILFFTFVLFFEGSAAALQDESLRYVISYKWGIIHKDAGEAVMTLKNSGDKYNVVLTAKSKPWADKIFKVRDTLSTVIRVVDLKPTFYRKATHEKGEYKLDEIKFTHTEKGTTGIAKRYRRKDGKWNVTEKSFSGSGPVFDMVSIFYYIRQFNFSKLDKNKVYTATVFSGKQKETVNIKSLGMEEIKLKDKSKRNAYHIRFNFTRDGGKKSSDDMDVWISADSRHIPLYLTAKLPVGEVRAYYTGG